MSFLEPIVKWCMHSTLQSCTQLPSEDLPKNQVLATQKTKPGDVCFPWHYELGLSQLTSPEIEAWNHGRMTSLIWQVAKAVPCGIKRALLYPQPKAFTDDQFADFIKLSALCILCQEESTTINKHKAETVYVMDCRHTNKIPTFPGMKSMGTKIRLTFDHVTEKITLNSIKLYPSKWNEEANNKVNGAVNNKVNNENKVDNLKPFTVTPKNKAWQVAKLLAMRSINHILVLQHHPLNHFPMTVIGAFAFSDLGEQNPIRWFLQPHFQYTLAINNAVLNDPDSILADHNSVASPFDVTLKAVHYADLQPAFSKFKIDQNIKKSEYPMHFTFAKMMADYKKVLRRWIQEFLQHDENQLTKKHKQEISVWFSHVQRHIKNWWPTYSSANLVDALTWILVKVTIEHGAQHYSYAQIPSEYKPWRWRGPLPQHPDDESVKCDNIHWPVDSFQEEVANRTFFSVNPASLLENVQYKKHTGELVKIDYENFKKSLKSIESKYPFIPLNSIAPSIDF